MGITVRELVNVVGFRLDAGSLRRVESRVSKAADRMQRVGTRLSIALTAPLAAIGLFSLKATSDVEQMNVAFKTMLRSAEKGKKLTKELFDFAERTPFQIENIGETAKQLLAVGFEQDEIIEKMTLLGNAASGLSVPLFRLVQNFGQVKAAGKLAGTELRDFTRAGLPLIDELKKILGVDKDIRKLVSTGDISFAAVEQAFRNMSAEGGIFENLMEEQAKTLGGVFSNFLDALFRVRARFGEVIVDAFNLKNAIRGLSSFLKKLQTRFEGLGKGAQKAVIFFLAFVAAIGPALIGLGVMIQLILFVGKALITVGSIFSGFAALFGAFTLPILLLIAAVTVALFLFIDDLIMDVAVVTGGVASGAF